MFGEEGAARLLHINMLFAPCQMEANEGRTEPQTHALRK